MLISKFICNDIFGLVMINVTVTLTITINWTFFALVIMFNSSSSRAYEFIGIPSLFSSNDFLFLFDISKSSLLKFSCKSLKILSMIWMNFVSSYKGGNNLIITFTFDENILEDSLWWYLKLWNDFIYWVIILHWWYDSVYKYEGQVNNVNLKRMILWIGIF